jgi:hypothetical protein
MIEKMMHGNHRPSAIEPTILVEKKPKTVSLSEALTGAAALAPAV